MEKIDQMIRDYIKSQRQAFAGGRRPELSYPSDKDLFLFVENRLQGDALNKMIFHLRNHPADEKLVLGARELLGNLKEAEHESVPETLIQKAKALRSASSATAPSERSLKCPHCGKGITPFKRMLSHQKLLNTLWFLGAVGAFLLSFAFPRYFIQCVALSVLFGIKWIVDQRASKTQILVYKALAESSEKAESSRLHEHKSHL